MTSNINTFLLLLLLVFTSCNGEMKEDNANNVESDSTEVHQYKSSEITALEKDSIINKLQGQWREPEYPFRVIHFKNATVKFIEEGIVEEPTFKEFTISRDCPFEVNNIKNARQDDIFLVMVNSQTCDILSFDKDSLTLSGFSTNTNDDYKIIYSKVK